MNTIIKFTDIDVDGCGANTETFIKVHGEVKPEAIEEVKRVVIAFKPNTTNWQTCDVIEAARECLSGLGYKSEYFCFDYEIEF